jgi:dTDP-4-amino-4,6-dideoxygalactose transaminase
MRPIVEIGSLTSMNDNARNKPAVEGGRPVRDDFLSFYRPAIGEDDIESVVTALRSGWLTLGPQTVRLERELESYLDVKHVVALSSCTEAMFLALKALGIGPGDEVITSALTFASTVHAILHTGATPVLADIEGATFGLSPDAVREKLTARTRAILPVHYGGQACLIEEILSIAAEHGLAVVEDAAHSFGASCNGRLIGGFGDATAFSFYATKNITTGEGGCLATNDDALAEAVRKLGFHGISRDAWKRYADRGSWYYEVEIPGYKSNMSDILASLGLSQLKKAGSLLARRKEIAAGFSSRLADSPWFQLPETGPRNRHSWHLYVVRLNLDRLRLDRDRFIAALTEENIGSSVHFIPIHVHPFFQPLLTAGDTFPRCDDFFARCISLPIFAGMNERDESSVVEALIKIAAYYEK